ncbi:MAG: 1,4-dihydroxy-2-naphthoate polyprenyltransferase [Acidimicrobiales bacterium]
MTGPDRFDGAGDSEHGSVDPGGGAPPGALTMWIAGARPRTLPAAMVPVMVGTAAAVGEGVEDPTSWWRAGAALVVAVALQVGVNFANDYSDGVRGTDDARRVGPLRLVGSGLVAAALVKRAATVAFGVAGAVGRGLAAGVGGQLLIVGAAALVAGWTYTGGPRPYGYLGLGELFVFVFFGVVATVGTTYVLVERVVWLSVSCSVAVGLWATALLVTNNLRDIAGDAAAGKRTLAVRIGDRATRLMYVAILVVSFAVAAGVAAARPGALLALAGAPLAVTAAREVKGGAAGPDLVAVLELTGRMQLLAGFGFAVGLAVSA